MSNKLMRDTRFYGVPVINHYCPACESLHGFAVEKPFPKGDQWSFNDDVNKPTFSPSMDIKWDSAPIDEPGEERILGRCHYFIEDGVIAFCSDSMHEFAGKKVPLPDIPRKYWLAGGVIPESISA